MKTLRKWFMVLAALSIFMIMLTGCGGGGGSSNPAPPTPPTTSSVSGIASKGPLGGATIAAYSLDVSGVKGASLGSSITDAHGAYSINIGTYKGAVIIEARGGTYKDEATGSTKSNIALLRAAVTNVSGSMKAAVTPMTEIAVQKAGTLTAAHIDSANALVSNLIGGTDIITTMPDDVLVSSSSTTAEKNYGLMLAAISELASNGTATSVSDAIAQIAADLADNTLNTTGTAISSALSTFITGSSNQTGLDASTAPVVSAISNATSNAASILQGVYHHIDQSAGLYTYVVNGIAYPAGMVYADNVTFTLDGYGNGTATGSGTEYDMTFTTTIQTTSMPISNVTFTYSSASGGSVTLGGDPYWVSADGMVMISSQASVNGVLHQSEQRVELKSGTNMNTASLSGTYAFVSQSVGFNGTGTPADVNFYGDSGYITFDGAGNYTSSGNGWFYEMNPVANTISQNQELWQNFIGTYSVASDGAITRTAETQYGGWVSADGNVFILGGPYVDGDIRAAEQDIGVKLGTSMSNALLVGTFKVAQQSTGFYLVSGNTGTVGGAMVGEYVDTIVFDGNGGCTWTSGVSTEYDMSESSISTNTNPGGGSTPCTYSVTSNGTTTLSVAGWNLTAWLSANGNTLIWGGSGWSNTSISGGAIPTLGGGPVWTEQGIGVKVQ